MLQYKFIKKGFKMENRKQFGIRNLREWKEKINEMFPVSIPQKSEWTSIEEIIKVLNHIGKPSLNHMLLPTGGGLDLTYSEPAIENGCIKLFTKSTFDIVKPKRLIFNSLGGDCSWDYFRLEIEKLNPSGVYDFDISDREELAYLSDGTYLDRAYWDLGYYEDTYGNRKEFTQDDNVITRYLEEGAFIIVAKTSIYNRIPGTYDARHNKMTDKEFYNYMKRSKNNFGK